jgi:hypothetical protein
LLEGPVRSKGKIIVGGILFWYPMAGVTYQFLHYMVGLRLLGYDPYYVEDSARWIYDPDINDLSPDASGNIAAVLPALEAHGFGDRWGFRGAYPGGRCYGMTEQQITELYREAEALLNVTGAQEIRDEHLAIKRRIYVETDPVASQVRVAHRDAEMIAMLQAHDVHFSFGENLGAGDCKVPVERFQWLHTRQPVVLELWENRHPPGAAYNTIGSWHTDGKDITFGGETYYWSKDREFLKLLDLPRRTSAKFELATHVDDETKALLQRNGWLQVDANKVSRDLESYRLYIQNSRGEFTVAKDQNIRLRSGWFSDRSACYLAAGRPVINQETGFSRVLPTGKGLFAFEDAEGVLAAIGAIESDYEAHARAAREIAAEYFAAHKVLGSLMERAGL